MIPLNPDWQLRWDIAVVFHKLHVTQFLNGVWRRISKNVWVKEDI